MRRDHSELAAENHKAREVHKVASKFWSRQ